MLNARSTIIDFYCHKIEALMLIENDQSIKASEAKFAIGVSQVSVLFSLLTQNATRDLKSLLGADLSLLKVQTDLNSNAINAITLDQFEKVILRLAVKGNKTAIELAESLIGLSLRQFVCDAFWIKFEREEREQYNSSRQAGKVSRSAWRDLVNKFLLKTEATDTVRTITFSELSNAINVAVTGFDSHYWRKKLQLVANTPLRDHLSAETLYEMDKIESVSAGLMRQGRTPMDSVHQAIKVLVIEPISEPLRD